MESRKGASSHGQHALRYLIISMMDPVTAAACRLCALANHPEGGRWPEAVIDPRALQVVTPAPTVVFRDGGWVVLPARAPARVRDTCWILEPTRPVAPTPEQLQDLLDAFGDAELDAEPANDVRRSRDSVGEPVFTGGLPGALSIELATYDGGMRECLALGKRPTQCTTLPAPLMESADSVANEALALLRGGDALERLMLEVLFNAVGHRSYAPRFSLVPIRVSVYTDAVSVASPGGFPRRSTDVSGAREHRWSRNRALMAQLRAAGRASEQGRTLPVVAERARRDGWDLQTQGTCEAVVVTVWAAPPQTVRGERIRLPAEERRLRVLRALDTREARTAREICEATGLPSSTVREVLKQLRADGAVAPLHHHSRSPKQAYRLTGSSAPPDAGRA